MIRPGRFGGPVGRNAMEDCACRGKNLDKMLQPAILACVYGESRCGQEILDELAENPIFQGEAPDKAGVYRYLKKLIAAGYLIESEETERTEGRPRRRYSITDTGRNCLGYWMQTLRYYERSIHYLSDKIEKLFCP